MDFQPSHAHSGVPHTARAHQHPIPGELLYKALSPLVLPSRSAHIFASHVPHQASPRFQPCPRERASGRSTCVCAGGEPRLLHQQVHYHCALALLASASPCLHLMQMQALIDNNVAKKGCSSRKSRTGARCSDKVREFGIQIRVCALRYMRRVVGC